MKFLKYRALASLTVLGKVSDATICKSVREKLGFCASWVMAASAV